MIVTGFGRPGTVVMLRVQFNNDLRRRAARAGLATWLGSVLLLALFTAPIVATHQDFNHYHPEGTPEHYHSIDSTLGSPVVTEIVIITLLVNVLGVLASLPELRLLTLVSWPANQPRAPPASLQF